MRITHTKKQKVKRASTKHFGSANLEKDAAVNTLRRPVKTFESKPKKFT